MTTTQIRTIDYRVPVEYYGDFAADYDTAAINAEVLDELNAKVPAGVTIAGGATGCPLFCASRIGRPRSPGSAGPSTGPV